MWSQLNQIASVYCFGIFKLFLLYPTRQYGGEETQKRIGGDINRKQTSIYSTWDVICIVSNHSLYCQAVLYIVKSWYILSNHSLYCQIIVYIVKSQSILSNHTLYCQIILYFVKSQSILSNHIIYLLTGYEGIAGLLSP